MTIPTRDPLIQNKQILHPFGNVWADAEQVSRKVSPLFDHPARGRMEAMVIAGSKVDDHEEHLVSLPERHVGPGVLMHGRSLAQDTQSAVSLFVVQSLCVKAGRGSKLHGHLGIVSELAGVVLHLIWSSIVRLIRSRRFGRGVAPRVGVRLLDLSMRLGRAQEARERVLDVVDLGKVFICAVSRPRLLVSLSLS